MAELRVVSADDDDVGLPADTELLGAWLVAAAADASVLIYDSLTVAGTAKAALACLAKTQSSFIPLCGVKWRTGISVDITGAGALLYLIVK